MVWLLIFTIMLGGFLLFLIALNLTEHTMKKKIQLRSIFRGFGQKMWMTVGLGTLFFGLYFVIVLVGSFINDPEVRLNLFFLIYKHPIPFIYLGLLLFASISTGIYFVRMLIKHIYNTRRKD